jgi:torulene dioxygenase
VELRVTGAIPAYAAGVLFRTGTGANEIECANGKTFKVHHWFDGLAVVHRFQILAPDDHDEQGKVRVLYNSRSVCDALIQEVRRTGKTDLVTFGRKYEPCTSLFKKVMGAFSPDRTVKDPSERSISITLSVNFPGLSNTGKKQHHGHASGIQTLCSKTDADLFQFVDPETLEPVGFALQEQLHPDLKGRLSATHAKSDPVTGDVFNYNLNLSPTATYKIFRVSAETGETKILASFNADGSYIHSFFLTEHYVILCVWNSFFAGHGASILLNKNIVDAIRYDASKPARWFVVDRRAKDEGGGGVVATYESDSFFCFHTINAFEEPSSDGNSVDIVADLSSYSNLDSIEKLYLPNLISTSPDALKYVGRDTYCLRPVFKRFRLPSIPKTAVSQRQRVTLEQVSEPSKCPELPTINPAYVLRRHRYVYGVVDTGKSTFIDSLVKYDTQTGEAIYWSEHGHTAGEAIFVPRERGVPNGESDEEDGVLLSIVLDGPAGRSYLLALDPKTMKEVGRASMEAPLGFAFHGTHVSSYGSEGIGGKEGRGLDF